MRNAAAVLCFFVSGFAGLVYEICWVREAGAVFGSTTFALSTVLAVFFGGLALGSELFGRVGHRLRRPVRLYALLEGLLAALALLSPLAFDLADTLYGPIYRELAGRTAALFAARVLLVGAVLLPPAVLMGGTLPLFCRQFVRRRERIGATVGLLYAVNTLGAAAGAAAAGFLLLPALGIAGTLRVGAAASLAAGLGAWALRLRAPEHEAPGMRTAPAGPRPGRAGHQDGEPASDPGARRQIVGGLFFLAGVVGLGQEVLWTRFLALIERSSVHTYTITLTVVLLGIVLGSILASLLADRARRPLLLGALLAGSGLATAAVMSLPPEVWRGLAGPIRYALLLLVPAALGGAAFPVANRMVLADPRLAARSVGRMAALNTLGGIVGALTVGFGILPQLGLEAGVRILTGLSVAGGLAAWLLLDRGGRPALRRVLAAGAASAWILAPSLSDVRLPADFLGPRELLVACREGWGSTLAVLRARGAKQLEIDRLWQGKDRKCHQIMAAHVPMLLHPDPRRVLVVGLGTGQTAGRFLMHEIEALDCVDIEPALFDFVAEQFGGSVAADPRVRLLGEDGRTILAHARERYDIISLEVGQVFLPGVEGLYTRECYERAAARLNPGGLLVQFVPLSFFPDEAILRSLVRTFLDVFPGSILWYNTAELLLIGGRDGPPRLLAERLELLRRDGPLREDLRYSQWGGPEQWLNRRRAFLAGYLCGPRELARLAGGAPACTDDRPRLAHACRRVTAGDGNEIRLAAMLKEHLADPAGLLTAPEPELVARAEALRARNLDDIIATALLLRAEARQGELPVPRLLALLQEALRWNPDSALGLRMLGDAAAAASRPDEAEAAYLRALSLVADDPLAQRGIACVLLQTGRPLEALAHLQAALLAMPDDGLTHNYLGAAHAHLGRLSEAERHFREAVRISPADASASANLARVRAELGMPAKAARGGGTSVARCP